MIATLEGLLDFKNPEYIILNVQGIGYEINISNSTYEKLPSVGDVSKLYIIETTGMYGGGTNLYGFLSPDEKDIFISFKENIKNIGAKKALDYLDKAMKSLPDFKRAVEQKNLKLLTSIFGFRKETAEKIVVALQNKIEHIKISGKEKWSRVSEEIPVETIQALVSLGYKEQMAKFAVEKVLEETDRSSKTEELIKLALKYLSTNA